MIKKINNKLEWKYKLLVGFAGDFVHLNDVHFWVKYYC